jgi:LuxR family transcriptional regulator, maltose regulon positive regulatory protein
LTAHALPNEQSHELDAVRAAMERGDYEGALRSAREALRVATTAEAYDALAEAAWWLPDESLCFEARETAYRLYRERGDRRGAARMAAWLAIDYLQFRGQPAVANGWLRRGERLLEGQPASGELSFLKVLRADLVLMLNNDALRASRLAAEGIDIARELGDVDREMYGLAVEGLSLVTSGYVDEGMSKLDEAAAACVSGEVSDRAILGTILCYMVDACDRVRDFDRAVQWCERALHFMRSWAREDLYAICRPHYAVVLTWRGHWQEAERELELATREMGALAPPMAVEGIVRLAELRWRQGRWEEAQSLFDQIKGEPLSQVGLGYLTLDQGRPQAALDLAHRCLRRLPLEDRVERVPALELAVRAGLALRKTAAAEQAVEELTAIEQVVQTKAPRGSVRLGQGLLAYAKGKLTEAKSAFEDAVDIFESCSAPFETARARLELAGALRALGRDADAAREAHLALEALQGVGAAKEAERARAFLAAIERSSQARPVGARDGSLLSPREDEVLRLLASGRSNTEIAEELVLSVRTVERHISNIYEKLGITGRSARAAAAAYAFGARNA